MDFLSELGGLALASRLRRLTDRLYREGEKVYAAFDAPFTARWFPVIARLDAVGKHPMTITEVAADLGITHPAVIKIVRELERKGLAFSTQDIKDARKRRISLTPEGERLVSEIRPLWEAFSCAARELFDEIGYDLPKVIDSVERALDKRDMSQRISSYTEGDSRDIEIVDHSNELAHHFRELNEQWLQEDFRIEPYDETQLADPEKEIINNGGFILYARSAGRIVGTVALVRLSSRRFELAKMAVLKSERGRGIGRRLLEAAVDRARSHRAASIVLMTHEKHEAATKLYRDFGFVDKATRIPSAKKTERAADGFSMELDLRTTTETGKRGKVK